MIRVQIPDMPSADELLPYLRRMDASRVYVNRGPLVLELENRLASVCGTPVVTVSSGTLALELTLRYHARRYTYADVPALTFCATGLAAQNAGLEVILRDMEEALQLSSDCTVGRSVMLLVATFGRPVDIDRWSECFHPVVIDAAGAFPAQKVSKDPNITTCFSLHATKFIGCGEGGFVASANTELLDAVRDMSTFGHGGTNAKLSEYHAAVALASLDRMAEKLDRTTELNNWYDECTDGVSFYDNRPFNTLKVAILPEGVSATRVGEDLKGYGIETRQWYRPWLDERPEFGSPHLPVTNSFRDRLLGVPFHLQLTRQDIRWVMLKLKEALK